MMEKGYLKRFALWFGLFVLVSTNGMAFAQGVNQVFLVQNSGWMLPFYDDSNSKLKSLVLEVANRVAPYGGGAQIVASFNQSFGGSKSPLMHYKGNDAAQFRAALDGIQPARKTGRSSYTDTDFTEAIVGAIKEFTPGQPALVWIITNNKNSPDNSGETQQKNKEFYRFLQDTPEIRRIVAFPYQMKVQSAARPDYRANGLMIYVLAYGAPADQVLQQMLEANVPFGEAPARLKPLNAEALTFVPKGVKGSDVTASLLADKKTLKLGFDAQSKPDEAVITGQFHNDFYPYDIRSAKVDLGAAFRGGKEGISAELSTRKITAISAGGDSGDVIVTIHIPALPSMWNPEVIFGSGYKALGVMRFELRDQELEISDKFLRSMAMLFPNDPLPDVFKPDESAKHSVTDQPLLIEVAYPSWPLIMVVGGALLLIGSLFAGYVMSRREKIYRVSIDGAQKTYGMRPGSEIVLKNQQGDRVGVLKRGFGKPVYSLDKGKTCQVRIM